MARYRLSEPARADIALILRRSLERYGKQGQIRYRACLSAALRQVAGDPHGPLTRDRAMLAPGVRSLHLRHSRNASRESPVANPVHLVFYRVPSAGLVEILRVLHERMEPADHLEPAKP